MQKSSKSVDIYTLHIVNYMHETFIQIKLYPHTDDISNLVTASNYDTLLARALQYAVEFKNQTDKLKLTISGTRAAVPNNASIHTFVRNATAEGIPLQTARQGVDIGIDNSAANHRAVVKQRERTHSVRKRAWHSRTNTIRQEELP